MSLREARATAFPGAPEGWSHGPLLELVEVAPQYERIARSLLGDVFVVETLEHAVSLWERNGMQATLVTLEGETISPEVAAALPAAAEMACDLISRYCGD